MRLRAREAAAAAILEAAEAVASQRGLEATSTAAIAARAGVAVGTLYNYFPDREALIAALFKYRRGEMIPRIESAAEDTRGLPFVERFRAYINRIARVFDAYRPFCRVSIASEASKVRGKSLLMQLLHGELVDMLRPNLGDRADEYALMILGAFKSLMQYRFERDQPFAPASDMLVDTFLHGMPAR